MQQNLLALNGPSLAGQFQPEDVFSGCLRPCRCLGDVVAYLLSISAEDGRGSTIRDICMADLSTNSSVASLSFFRPSDEAFAGSPFGPGLSVLLGVIADAP